MAFVGGETILRKSSYVVAETPATDLAVVRAMVEELETYLLADQLYRTITVSFADGPQNLQMTGADLLTRLRRLRGHWEQLSADEQHELTTLQTKTDAILRRWHGQFQQRLRREIKARLDSLQWFLEDCTTETQRCHIEFPFEMRNRQRIDEALAMLDAPLNEPLQQRLQAIDAQIRRLAPPAPFLWDERLQPIFPKDPYWYLYRRPPHTVTA
ncbi:MAG: hypothetical protein KDE53_16660 [Caldilineaceae bacterium]|nr:hypothetical protein [Caldilineaceae bacterium]